MGNVNGYNGDYICMICRMKYTEYNSTCLNCSARDSLTKKAKWIARGNIW